MSKLEIVFVSQKTFGNYTGTLEWCVKDDVWIDNCYLNKAYDRETGAIIDIDDKRREVSENVRPIKIVPQPIEGRAPIDGTGLLWYFDPRYLSVKYVFVPPLEIPVTAWAIRIDDTVYIYNAETGKQIGRSKPTTASRSHDNIPLFRGNYKSPSGTLGSVTLEYYSNPSETGGWTYSKNIAKASFSSLGATNIDLIQPAKEQVANAITNPNTKFWFSVGHGAPQYVSALFCASEVAGWIKDRPPMWFTFLNHCSVMSRTGPGTISYAFMRGQTKGTVTVGLKIAQAPSDKWEKNFYARVIGGKTWKDAFDYANATNVQDSGMYGFCGDITMRLIGTTSIPELTALQMGFAEVTKAELPARVEGWMCSLNCPVGYRGPGTYRLKDYPFPGYSLTRCNLSMEWGAHGCPNQYKPTFVILEKDDGVAPPTTPPTTPPIETTKAIAFKAIPTEATVTIKKIKGVDVPPEEERPPGGKLPR